MRHLHANERLLVKLRRSVDWAILNRLGDFSSSLSVGFAPNFTDPPCFSCLKLEEISLVGGVRKGGAATFTYCGRWWRGI